MDGCTLYNPVWCELIVGSVGKLGSLGKDLLVQDHGRGPSRERKTSCLI